MIERWKQDFEFNVIIVKEIVVRSSTRGSGPDIASDKLANKFISSHNDYEYVIMCDIVINVRHNQELMNVTTYDA